MNHSPLSAGPGSSDIEDQRGVIRFLSRPAAFGGGCRRVDREDTHISRVFLCGDRALKLKRAVRYPYLDFSTVDRRRAACEAEVAVNARTAPGLYRGAVGVTQRADGTLALGGRGVVVDWVVDMNRFDRESLFDRKAVRGELDRRLMEDLADIVARFHEEAPIRRDVDATRALAATIDTNRRCLTPYVGTLFDQADVERLNDTTHRAFSRCRRLLMRRRRRGCVRSCHGDLHLRNIFLLDGVPTLFDAIEFNEDFSQIDVLYDLAFLLMDLEHRNLRGLASMVLNRYLDVTGDGGGFAALPLFLSLRAAIRAHVCAADVVSHRSTRHRERVGREAADYLARAIGYLCPSSPRLVAVGGLSGTGKSRLARCLAPDVGTPPGARVVRSDVIRKRLGGVSLVERLPSSAYSDDMTTRTYRALYSEARAALRAGRSVIADAVFARPGQRQRIADVALCLGVPFDGLWLDAPRAVMERRVSERPRNVSDATIAVVQRQIAYDVGGVRWSRIDSSGPKEATLAEARSRLRRG